MALPTTLPITAADAYQSAAQMAQGTLGAAQAMRDNIARGGVRVEQLCDLFDFLRSRKDEGQRLAQIPGVEAYAKTINGADYSLLTNFGTVLAAGTAITDWIIATIGDAQDGIVTRRFVVGAITERVVLSEEEIAPLIPLLIALMSAIKD